MKDLLSAATRAHASLVPAKKPSLTTRTGAATPFKQVLRAPKPARGFPELSGFFKAKLGAICRRFKIDPAHLLAVMFNESRLDPKAKNPMSSATGLIQFMPDVAADLLEMPKVARPAPPRAGATAADWKRYGDDMKEYRAACRARERQAIERVSRMSAEEQLDLVEKYIEKAAAGRPIKSVQDMYMCTFWPKAIGKGPDYVIAREGEKGLVYAQNKGFDLNKDGVITAGECAAVVQGVSGAPKVRAIAAESLALTAPARRIWA
jgi:hypothetical protein